jgi:hypothetical protein
MQARLELVSYQFVVGLNYITFFAFIFRRGVRYHHPWMGSEERLYSIVRSIIIHEQRFLNQGEHI